MVCSSSGQDGGFSCYKFRMKLCTGPCGQEKAESEFYKSVAKGLQAYCKSCKTNIKRDWISKNRDKVRWNAIYTKYRLRPEDVQEMLARQSNACAICKELFRTVPHIDHDHVSGLVRGLLCRRCNHLTGWMEKHQELVPNVYEYLTKARESAGVDTCLSSK